MPETQTLPQPTFADKIQGTLGWTVRIRTPGLTISGGKTFVVGTIVSVAPADPSDAHRKTKKLLPIRITLRNAVGAERVYITDELVRVNH